MWIHIEIQKNYEFIKQNWVTTSTMPNRQSLSIDGGGVTMDVTTVTNDGIGDIADD